MNRIIIIFVIFSLFSCLVPIQATNIDSEPSYDIESSIETFLLRKAYPYEDKALQYQKYFSDEQTRLDASEQTVDSSSSFPSSIGLNGPMNSSWPMKSYNAQHIGRTTSSTIDNPGLEKWRFTTLLGGVDSGAIFDNDGLIYFGSTNWYICAVYPNGTSKWIYKTSNSIDSTPALADDGTIYIASCDCHLYAFRPNGDVKWKYNVDGISFSSPVLADNGTIYIGTSEGKLFAINPNGTCQWCYDFMSGIYGDEAVGADGTIYVGTWDNYLNALHPNGTLKWRFPTGNHVKGVPSIAPDNTIYFGSWDGYLYALYPNGTMRWRCRVGSGTETTPAIAADGTIYVGGDDLYAVYPNGTMRWTFNLGSIDRHIFMSCPAIAAEGTIYVGVDVGESTAGEILAVNPNGTERWRKTISDNWCDSSPAIAEDGTVYIGSTGYWYGGGLHAFGAIESNTPPNPPVISGTVNGDAGKAYDYMFLISDPDNNPVSVFVDWGDGTNAESYESVMGYPIKMSHAWANKGTYTIKAKARDSIGAESNWTTLDVTMPYSYEQSQFHFIQWLLNRFPNSFPILRFIFGYPK